MKKRLLALLLCLVMVIGLVPVALATGDAEGETQQSLTAPTDGRYAVFYVNGEEVERTENVVKYDDIVPTPSYNTSRLGYTFDGWYENSEKTGDKWNFGSGKMPEGKGSEKGFYATLTENSYTITFNANGGTGTMPDKTFVYSDGGTLLPFNAFTKADATFVGWGLDRKSVV